MHFHCKDGGMIIDSIHKFEICLCYKKFFQIDRKNRSKYMSLSDL